MSETEHLKLSWEERGGETENPDCKTDLEKWVGVGLRTLSLFLRV